MYERTIIFRYSLLPIPAVCQFTVDMKMALAGSGSRILFNTAKRRSYGPILSRRLLLNPPWPRRLPFTVSATPKKLSSLRIGKFDSKSRRSGPLPSEEQLITFEQGQAFAEIDATAVADNGFVMPELPGDKPNFWFIKFPYRIASDNGLYALSFIAYGTTKEQLISKKLLYTRKQFNLESFLKHQMHLTQMFESNPTEQAPSLEY